MAASSPFPGASIPAGIIPPNFSLPANIASQLPSIFPNIISAAAPLSSAPTQAPVPNPHTHINQPPQQNPPQPTTQPQKPNAPHPDTPPQQDGTAAPQQSGTKADPHANPAPTQGPVRSGTPVPSGSSRKAPVTQTNGRPAKGTVTTLPITDDAGSTMGHAVVTLGPQSSGVPVPSFAIARPFPSSSSSSGKTTSSTSAAPTSGSMVPTQTAKPQTGSASTVGAGMSKMGYAVVALLVVNVGLGGMMV